MFRFVLLAFVIMCGLTPKAYAFDSDLLTIGLADDTVQITTGFNGSRLTIFGVKREQGDLAIVVRGPERRVTVRRKGQSLGMWRNVDDMRFRNVPSYYDFAMSGVEREIAPAILRREYGIGVDSLNFDALGRNTEAEIRTFREALIRNKQMHGHFALEPEKITFLSDEFFRVDFDIPADVPTGRYTIMTYLFQDGRAVGERKTDLRIGQVGFSASVYRFAHNNSLMYGIAAVLMALFAGWLVNLFFRKE